ncbi:hypothetical protein H5J22_10985 [Cetobacterium sp. 8H]|uniref:hypothetical protein n=1 Tax=Cetobacterium sp. 8H TaxID=2759681 RepID=UPI00163C0AFA|nr:hypothetical protein [Cetobacterium sp. 8H]MBC2851921.1 hypothetical protein [Cetobacterium sp. 8H]
MKNAKDFTETLSLLTEDFEYTVPELEEDISDLLRTEFELTLLDEDSKKYFLLKSDILDKNIKLFVNEIKEDEDFFYLINSIETSEK